MKQTAKVRGSDYRKARFIINTITKFMPAKSPATIAIIQNAEKIIMLYHMQNKGIPTAIDINNPENVVDMFQQNAKMYFETRAAAKGTKTR